ncbi:MAG: DUF1569 domain-containing protein [Burkholderiaceae bacterium]
MAYKAVTQPIQSRRSFIGRAAAAGASVAAGSLAGCSAESGQSRHLVFATLDQAMRETDRLIKIADLEPETDWSLPQTLVHCAQSIEFSLGGFPEMKSALFQSTVGSLAFKVFEWRGHMTHDLAEPIPGAPSIADQSDLNAAVTRVQKAVADFRAASGELKPHFAYGELSKAQYELAHAMHFANHYSAIKA